MVNIELYRIFIAIYRAGTISKAAMLCDITQPAASQQLASLERILKVKLFDRTPRRMVASNAGHELYTKVADSFDWLDFVSQDFLLQRDEKEALLHIGMPLAFYSAVLSEKLSSLSFRLDIHFGTHEELSEKLLEGKIDMMLSDEGLKKSNFYSESFMSQRLCLVGSKEIMAPTEGFSSWHHARTWVVKQDWISYDVELSHIRAYFKTLFDLQPNIDPKFIIPNMPAMLQTLKSTKCVSILPNYLCRKSLESGELVLLHELDKQTLYISYESSAKNNVLIKKFKAIMNALKSDII